MSLLNYIFFFLLFRKKLKWKYERKVKGFKFDIVFLALESSILGKNIRVDRVKIERIL